MNTQANILTLAASPPMLDKVVKPAIPTKESFNVVIDSTIMKGLGDLAQGIVAELTLHGRNAVNIRGMLDASDFTPIEEAAEQLAERFGASSDPIKRLRAKLDDYGKIEGNTRYTVKRQKIDGDMQWSVIEKQAKKTSPKQAAKSLSEAQATIIKLTSSLSNAEKQAIVDGLAKSMGL